MTESSRQDRGHQPGHPPALVSGKVELLATAGVSNATSFSTRRSFQFGYQGGVRSSSAAADLRRGLTVTVGAPSVGEPYFPADFDSIPRHVPQDWVDELKSIGTGEQLDESDGFYEQE